jgi:hypothetical protein
MWRILLRKGYGGQVVDGGWWRWWMVDLSFSAFQFSSVLPSASPRGCGILPQSECCVKAQAQE